MNYRHHFHAGNYADVFKHVLLLQLVRAMQRKEKGFLYLDTHAGRGGYDLSNPPVLPDGRSREPEYPAGIGRLWDSALGRSPVFKEYLELIRRFNDRHGAIGPELKFYPGSPWVTKLSLRSQDRMALFELREEDAEALDFDFARESKVTVQAIDGYTGLKASLPPPEKRALVLIDPPFESKAEFADILQGIRDLLKRLPGAVCAVWYPVTERARVDQFHREFLELSPPPTLFAEISIAGDGSLIRMKGCGLLVLNPPWQIEGEIRAALPELVKALKVDGGAGSQFGWLVPER